MPDRRDIDELKEQGASVPAPEAVAALYREAFERFGVRALWSRRPSVAPTIGQALVIARSLRSEGDMPARRLAARLEDACRAALCPASLAWHKRAMARVQFPVRAT